MRNSAAIFKRMAVAFLVTCVLLPLGCEHTGRLGDSRLFRYFERPDPYDPWSLKISQWQVNQRRNPAVAAAPSSGSDLRSRYLSVQGELRRRLASDLAEWIQEESKVRYSEDIAVDHWPTLDEVLASERDDCDGLELIVHQLLLDLGFPSDQVYRAVVSQPADGRHHMVTLWFEDPNDPWVIDPTGAMVMGMPRMSEVPNWVPLKLFSAREEFTVRQVTP